MKKRLKKKKSEETAIFKALKKLKRREFATPHKRTYVVAVHNAGQNNYGVNSLFDILFLYNRRFFTENFIKEFDANLFNSLRFVESIPPLTELYETSLSLPKWSIDGKV